jgi:hypothetical protein
MPRITREDLIRAEKDYRAGKYGDDPRDDRRRLPNLTPKFASWGAARLSLIFIALLHTVAFPPYDVTVATMAGSSSQPLAAAALTAEYSPETL